MLDRQSLYLVDLLWDLDKIFWLANVITTCQAIMCVYIVSVKIIVNNDVQSWKSIVSPQSLWLYSAINVGKLRDTHTVRFKLHYILRYYKIYYPFENFKRV